MAEVLEAVRALRAKDAATEASNGGCESMSCIVQALDGGSVIVRLSS